MTEKKKAIIEAAIKLFAKKGFSSTSIQEIANECGISKGAFYIHFKSKDSLLMSIFHYYYDMIDEKVSEIGKLDLAPRERFKRQLTVHYEEISKHKEFIIMQARENALPFNNDLQEFLLKMRKERYLFISTGILAIYGEDANPLIGDLTILFQGMIDGYLELVILNGAELDFQSLADFLIRRLDDIVAGAIRTKESPILTQQTLDGIRRFLEKDSRHEMALLLEQMKLVAEGLENRENLLITLDVLEDEITGENTRLPVIQGMLANLTGMKEFEPYKKKIEHYYKLGK